MTNANKPKTYNLLIPQSLTQMQTKTNLANPLISQTIYTKKKKKSHKRERSSYLETRSSGSRSTAVPRTKRDEETDGG
jgi:hypothetical protein